MIDFEKLSQEVFDVLHSYNYVMQLFDDDGSTVQEPTDARIFYSKDANLQVNLIEDQDNSTIELTIGKTVDINSVSGLNQSLRTCADKYGINFSMNRSEEQISPKKDVLKKESREEINLMADILTEKIISSLKKQLKTR